MLILTWQKCFYSLKAVYLSKKLWYRRKGNSQWKRAAKQKSELCVEFQKAVLVHKQYTKCSLEWSYVKQYTKCYLAWTYVVILFVGDLQIRVSFFCWNTHFILRKQTFHFTSCRYRIQIAVLQTEKCASMELQTSLFPCPGWSQFCFNSSHYDYFLIYTPMKYNNSYKYENFFSHTDMLYYQKYEKPACTTELVGCYA